MTTFTGVGGIISAAHSGPDGRMHGHTWEVTAWFRCPEKEIDEAEEPCLDAVHLQNDLNAALSLPDHGILPDAISRGEDLAKWLGSQLNGCVRVDVFRTAERIYARWEA